MRIYYVLAVVLSLLQCACSQRPQFTLAQQWQTAGLRTPESVLIVGEGAAAQVYVSQIDGNGGEADGKGEIALLTPDGSLVDADWITGLNAPKGMAAFENRLYVADLTELVIIDIAQKQIVQKLPLPQAKFANDVAVDKNGVVYVSDTMAHQVYKYSQGNASVLVKDTDNANGLFVTDSGLLIGCAEELKFYDFKQQKLTTLEGGFTKNLDGIAALDDTHFLLSVWAGKIYEYTLGGHKAVLLDSTEQKINTADIALDQKTRVLYVPNFANNTVTAYKLLP